MSTCTYIIHTDYVHTYIKRQQGGVSCLFLVWRTPKVSDTVLGARTICHEKGIPMSYDIHNYVCMYIEIKYLDKSPYKFGGGVSQETE